jgi:pantetheine-phosphate adenylyltransferase
MSKSAIFPGSFDPFTIGHADIVNRALPYFDKIIIAIGNNSSKQYLFSVEERIISVITYDGLTADFCKENEITTIIRGLRSVIDFEYEQSIAQMNSSLGNGPETFFLMCKPEHAHISSTIIRDIIRNGGDAKPWTII